MKLIKDLALLGILVLFLSAAVYAQQPVEQTTAPPNPAPGVSDAARDAGRLIPSPGLDQSRPKGVWLAQAQEVSDEQMEQTRENLMAIKERLDQRSQALQEEWDELKKEEAELNKISQGRTLQGSRANRFSKRVNEFNQRMMQYNEKNEALRKDVEAYEMAVKNMQAAARDAAQHRYDEGAQREALGAELGKIGLAAPSSLESREEIEEITALLEGKREELEAEYNALQAERQQVSAAMRQGGEYGASVSSIQQQVYEINERTDELAKRRELFNNVVTSVNELLGQDIQPLPEP